MQKTGVGRAVEVIHLFKPRPDILIQQVGIAVVIVVERAEQLPVAPQEIAATVDCTAPLTSNSRNSLDVPLLSTTSRLPSWLKSAVPLTVQPAGAV